MQHPLFDSDTKFQRYFMGNINGLYRGVRSRTVCVDEALLARIVCLTYRRHLDGNKTPKRIRVKHWKHSRGTISISAYRVVGNHPIITHHPEALIFPTEAKARNYLAKLRGEGVAIPLRIIA